MSWKINVEIPIFISVFSFMLTANVSTNLVIYRTCYVILGYNQTECALLGTGTSPATQNLEKLVEPEVNTINMIRSMVESSITLVLCFFIGPWSDRFGRKPIIVGCLLGSTISFIGMIIFSVWDTLSPWYLLIISIPNILSGGQQAFRTSCFAYITDITSNEHRGMRMGIFEGFMALGMLVGNTVGPYLFYATNYEIVYAISCLGCAISVIYAIVYLPESLQNRETEGRFKGFFHTTSVKDMFRVAIVERPDFNRCILFLCILIITISTFAMAGDMTLNFMFVRTKFDWSLEKYTWFSSAGTLIWITGTVLGVYVLNKLLRMTESIISLIGTISLINGALVTALATKDWHLYFGSILAVLGGVLSPMVRTMVSKLVHENEVGKIFTFLMICSSSIGMAASPLYTLIYNKTINTNPAYFVFVTAGFHAVNLLVLVLIIILQNKRPSIEYTSVPDDSEENVEETINNNNELSIATNSNEFTNIIT